MVFPILVYIVFVYGRARLYIHINQEIHDGRKRNEKR